MNAGVVHLIGFLASVVSFLVFIPQAAKVWTFRKSPHALLGVSVGSQVLILLNASLWGVYGFLTGAFWVAAPGIINAPLAVMSLVLIMRARSQETIANTDTTGCPHCGWDSDAEHEIFITAPPGYGSIMSCNEVTAKHGVPRAVHSGAGT